MPPPLPHVTTVLLRQIPLLAQLPDSALASLIPHCKPRRYGPREYLFHEGDDGSTLYLLLAGQVSVQRINDLGQIVFIAQRGPGDLFGEMALLDGGLRSADVVTVEACVALTLGRGAFLDWLAQEPEAALRLLAAMAQRLRQATDLLDEYKSLDAMGRLCARLLELVEVYGEPMASGGVRIRLKLTQEQLAERVGADRATVNRLLATLKQMKAVQSDGRLLVVTDSGRLRQYAGE